MPPSSSGLTLSIKSNTFIAGAAGSGRSFLLNPKANLFIAQRKPLVQQT